VCAERSCGEVHGTQRPPLPPLSRDTLSTNGVSLNPTSLLASGGVMLYEMLCMVVVVVCVCVCVCECVCVEGGSEVAAGPLRHTAGTGRRVGWGGGVPRGGKWGCRGVHVSKGRSTPPHPHPPPAPQLRFPGSRAGQHRASRALPATKIHGGDLSHIYHAAKSLNAQHINTDSQPALAPGAPPAQTQTRRRRHSSSLATVSHTPCSTQISMLSLLSRRTDSPWCCDVVLVRVPVGARG
jgi:hypothetical protein